MKVVVRNIILIVSWFITSVLLIGCLNYTPGESSGNPEPVHATQHQKPGSSFTDTLVLKGPVAVFFEPDSRQLEKIRQVTNAQVFKGSMHEYTYQIRNAKMFLKEYWPHVKILETKAARYLKFYYKGATEVIDLDSQDPCGMFLSDGEKKPLLIDMMNVDTQVPNYFQSRS